MILIPKIKNRSDYIGNNLNIIYANTTNKGKSPYIPLYALRGAKEYPLCPVLFPGEFLQNSSRDYLSMMKSFLSLNGELLQFGRNYRNTTVFFNSSFLHFVQKKEGVISNLVGDEYKILFMGAIERKYSQYVIESIEHGFPIYPTIIELFISKNLIEIKQHNKQLCRYLELKIEEFVAIGMKVHVNLTQVELSNLLYEHPPLNSIEQQKIAIGNKIVNSLREMIV